MTEARTAAAAPQPLPRHKAGSDAPFFLALGGLGGSYVLLIVLMLVRPQGLLGHRTLKPRKKAKPAGASA